MKIKLGISICDIMENEIWLAKVTQSDLNNSKIRPLLVVSNNIHNKNNEDIIGFWITTNLEHDYSFKINKKYIISGKLFDESAVRCDGIIRINKNLLFKKIIKTKSSLKNEVIRIFNQIL